jgi:spermidine/putrescine transport system substrate-binding protein
MAKKSLSPQAQSVISSKFSRRTLLAGAGAVAGASALAACGSGGSTGSAKNTVRWGNWPLYLDVDASGKNYTTLQAFTKETKIDVKYL